MLPQKSYTVEEAQKNMERYCAYQERCHKEVQQKLRNMKMIPEAINLITTQLIEDNYLNETRFAKAFARGKFNTKKWGRQRIVRELKARDIGQYNIKIALKEISEEAYLQTFEKLAQKRIQQLETEKNFNKKKKKLADYLFYRGWEPELVWEKVRELNL